MLELTIPAAADAQIDRRHPKHNYGRRPTAKVGRTGGGERYRSLFVFPVQERLPDGAKINSAWLVLPVARFEPGGAHPESSVHRVLQPWREDRVTWHDQPACSEDPCACATPCGTHDGVLEADVTALAQDWLSGERHNAGVLLRWACGEAPGRVVLYTRESAWCDRWPVLRLRYRPCCPGCGIPPIPWPPLPVEVINPVEIESRLFDLHETLTIRAGGSASHMQEASRLRIMTLFVTNEGPGEALIDLQVSPDGVAFASDTAAQTLAPGHTAALVAQTFARYTRFRGAAPRGRGTRLRLRYQGQIG